MARVTRWRLRLSATGEGFSAYASLLEEAATLASAEAGYPSRWYGRENTAWVIRRTTIECGAPLPCAADLEITTWVTDFRRVRSRREYEVHVSPRPVAALTAHTDWVYVDRATSTDPRCDDARVRSRRSPSALPRAPLALPPPPAGAASLTRVVAPEDVDALGHVNNARYFGYVEEVERTAVGSTLRPVRHDLEYLVEARAGDRLICRCWLVESRESATETAVEILLAADGAPLTRARSVWAA
jgi:acyl-CoA thioester hydrolase